MMTKEEQAALGAVSCFLDSYAGKNVEGCMSAIAASKPILLLGTNEDEVFRSAKQVRSAFSKDFDSMSNIRWGKDRNVHIKATSRLASVIVERPVSYRNEGKGVKTLFRYALTLIKERGKWKVCAGAASVPFPADFQVEGYQAGRLSLR